MRQLLQRITLRGLELVIIIFHLLHPESDDLINKQFLLEQLYKESLLSLSSSILRDKLILNINNCWFPMELFDKLF